MNPPLSFKSFTDFFIGNKHYTLHYTIFFFFYFAKEFLHNSSEAHEAQ